MRKSTILISAFIFLICATPLITYALLNASQTVHYSGSITAVNLGVYLDSACTINATALTVGTINPASTATQIIYIKNTGNVQETLIMSVSNWNPANANSVLTLSWDKQNAILLAGQVVQATLTLTAAANTGTLTNFGCDVTITGSQS